MQDEGDLDTQIQTRSRCLGSKGIGPQSWIEVNEETEVFMVHIGGRADFPAEGLWEAVGLIIKLSYIFNLEYNPVVISFWDLLGRLFFNTPCYNKTNMEIKNAICNITGPPSNVLGSESDLDEN